MRAILNLITSLCLLLTMACTNNNSHLQSLRIDVEDSYTDNDKDHINDYNYFVDVADSIIFYNKNGDVRNVGRLFKSLKDHKNRASYWGSHTNSALKQQIDNNIILVEQALSDNKVPDEVTYRIYFSEVYIEPKNGVITREGYNNYNAFDQYNLSIDEDGYVVRTIRRDNGNIEKKPLRDVKTIKDLSGEYTFRNLEEMKIEVISH